MAISANYNETSGFGYVEFKEATKVLGLHVAMYSMTENSFVVMATDSVGSVIVRFDGGSKPTTFDADYPRAVQASAVSVGN